MSCDWTIKCVDCGVDAGFSDANHKTKLMRELIKQAPIMGDLFVALGRCYVEMFVEFTFIPVSFFVEHGKHRLVAMDEYGREDDA